ncbi:MAG: hypothetical protein WA945_11455 [Arcobacteraceae bacterium]
MINIIFTILWILALVLFSIILFLILLPYLDISSYETLNSIVQKMDTSDLTTSLVPLGVLISAALASTSVMKSIHNTNDIEKRKDKEKVENTDKYLESILLDLNFVFIELDLLQKDIDTVKNHDFEIMTEENIDEEQKSIINEYNSIEKHQLLDEKFKHINQLFNAILVKFEDKDLIYYGKYRNENKIIASSIIRIIRVLQTFEDKIQIDKDAGIEIQLKIKFVASLKILYTTIDSVRVTINTHITNENFRINQKKINEQTK